MAPDYSGQGTGTGFKPIGLALQIKLARVSTRIKSSAVCLNSWSEAAQGAPRAVFLRLWHDSSIECSEGRFRPTIQGSQ